MVFHSLRHTSEYTCLRSFISWQSRRKTHNLLHKMCSLSFIQRKRLTNIFNETSKPSSFCCLPIITIGVVDYRHCNQKNLKIYLSTLHKSVQMHIKWEYILKFTSFCDRISLLKSVQMHGKGERNDGD